jgi:hypothetical protein
MNENEQVEVLKEKSNAITQWASDVRVVCAADADNAIAGLAKIKTVRAAWCKYWEPLKRSANEAWKGIVAKEKEGTEHIDKAEEVVKRKVLAWQNEERIKAEAEQRRLQAIADEQARKERERLEAQAAKLKTPEKAQERLEQAAAVVAPVITVAAPVMQGTRSTWKAQLVSIQELIKAAVPGSVAESMLAFNDSAANSLARSKKGAVNVPGIKFVEEFGLSVRKQ